MNPSSLIGHVTELLQSSDRTKQPTDRLAAQFFRDRRYLGSGDRRFISESFYGIIRHRRYCEALIEQYLAEHPANAALDEPDHRYVTLFVIYSLTRENSAPSPEIPSIPRSIWTAHFPGIDFQEFHAWVTGHSSLEYLNEPEEVQLGVKYSFQDWMVEEWHERLGVETEKLLVEMNRAARVTLRVNLLKTTRDECRDRLRREGVETETTSLSPEGLIAWKRFNTHVSDAFNDGWFEVQDEGSQLVSLIANPLPGQTVIDACAGAGGKALHLAALMRNEGEVVAIDTDRRRLRELERRALRAGATNIKPLLRDEMLPDNFSGVADLVLVDAPCSGTGTIRRNPALKWSVTPSLIAHYHAMQSEIISFNARFVKPGGILVYATCSLMRDENESVVVEFLKVNDRLFHEISPAIEQFGITRPVDQPSLTLFPHHYHADGFFIAALRREAARG